MFVHNFTDRFFRSSKFKNLEFRRKVYSTITLRKPDPSKLPGSTSQFTDPSKYSDPLLTSRIRQNTWIRFFVYGSVQIPGSASQFTDPSKVPGSAFSSRIRPKYPDPFISSRIRPKYYDPLSVQSFSINNINKI